jgi:zinc and cadmium transporter
MVFWYIVLATAAGSIVSVLVAATLTVGLLDRITRSLVSLSAGVLLGTALLHVLPEAFSHGHGHVHRIGQQVHHHATPAILFATLLGGILFFWLLEKIELHRHGHVPPPALAGPPPTGRGALTVLVGDGIHNFCDGVVIASAFLADPALGVTTALAMAAHEIPQEAGDYIVLLNTGFTRARALLWNAASGLLAVAGGMAGYALVGSFDGVLPYLLVTAASSFLYVAMTDLLPQLQQRLPPGDTFAQLALLATGLGVVGLARALLQGPAH